MSKTTSQITEVVASWRNVKQLFDTGDKGSIVPVVIPKDERGYGPLFMALIAIYFLVAAIFDLFFTDASGFFAGLYVFLFIACSALTGIWLWQSSMVRIEQGKTGVKSSFGKITKTLSPGRHFLIWPWERVLFVVNTSAEFPYSAPVLACPTQENVPLKTIEYFLKFKIDDAVKFVRRLGASNFDIVLSSAVQDAIRRRSRRVRTEDAYDLRGSDVGDMQEYLNKQLANYGVRIVGSNIPDVQLPDQYQQNLATRERVAKELSAYEKEWELIRKQRTDALLLEIERAKKNRAARSIEVKEAINKAREDVAQMLQEKETEAEKIRLEIEAEGQATLKSAENEARALNFLGRSYKDNWAVLQYQLALHRLEVAEQLVQDAPRPILVHSEGEGEQSALSTLMMAQILPGVLQEAQKKAKPSVMQRVAETASEAVQSGGDLLGDVTNLAKRAISERSRKRS